MYRTDGTVLPMADSQLTFKENDIAQLVNSAYEQLRSGDFGEASDLLERALELDVEYEGITAALKGVRFWTERQQRVQQVAANSERAAYLLDQWATFRGFAERIQDLPERCYQDIKYFVHSTALTNLLQSRSLGTTRRPGARAATGRQREPSSYTRYLVQVGYCYKAMGDFATAIDYLEQANTQDRNWPPLLAELADCYALIDETRAAKLFFREAFFLGPAEIAVERLESPLIKRLEAEVKRSGVTGEVCEWIPVYGTLLEAFSIKRVLRPLEYGQLRQSIFELEQSLGVTATGDGVVLTPQEEDVVPSALVPRLINRYFWLIDHYVATDEEQAKVDDVLLRLRALDLSVYQRFVA